MAKFYKHSNLAIIKPEQKQKKSLSFEMLKQSDKKALVYLKLNGLEGQEDCQIQPIQLPCGHYKCECKNCSKDEKCSDTKCSDCIERKNSKLDKDSMMQKNDKKINIIDLFKEFDYEFKHSLDEFKEEYKQQKGTIEFEKIKEIAIRAESLKNEIDELCEIIYKDLEMRKTKSTNNFNNMDSKLMVEKQFHGMFDKIIGIEITPNCFCVLPNNQLLVSSYIDQVLCLYDGNFKLVKKVLQLNGIKPLQCFEPYTITTNGKDRIYISELRLRRILMADFDFNFLAQTELFLQSCAGMCYANGFIYSCDVDCNSIRIHNENLVFQKGIQLPFSPLLIQVIDDIACIRHADQVYISFYSLSDLKVKHRYRSYSGLIGVKESNFYEFDQLSSVLIFYNPDGTVMYSSRIHRELEVEPSARYVPFTFYQEEVRHQYTKCIM